MVIQWVISVKVQMDSGRFDGDVVKGNPNIRRGLHLITFKLTIKSAGSYL